MHPRITTLIAYGDGETGAERSRRIAKHLSKCEKCHEELRRIEREKDELSVRETGDARGDLQPDLAGLLTSVAAWREGRTAVLASNVMSRVRWQLEVYLGSAAASHLERPDMRAGELLAKTGEVLEAFLGPAAADAVREDVLAGLECARAAAETHR